MNKQAKFRIITRLTRHGFAPWQVNATASWASLTKRDWRKLAWVLLNVKV